MNGGLPPPFMAMNGANMPQGQAQGTAGQANQRNPRSLPTRAKTPKQPSQQQQQQQQALRKFKPSGNPQIVPPAPPVIPSYVPHLVPRGSIPPPQLVAQANGNAAPGLAAMNPANMFGSPQSFDPGDPASMMRAYSQLTAQSSANTMKPPGNGFAPNFNPATFMQQFAAAPNRGNGRNPTKNPPFIMSGPTNFTKSADQGKSKASPRPATKPSGNPKLVPSGALRQQLPVPPPLTLVKEGESSEPISQPHDHDVMCGRGGLTNFHRGNVWYRRIVKCNRQLYRDSAKYTKLLMSKAIVQAVHSQTPPGRFIENDKDTGEWKQIPYKKALDKTSQALREKDREGEDDDDDLDGLDLQLVRIPLPSSVTGMNGTTQVSVKAPPPMPAVRRDNPLAAAQAPPSYAAPAGSLAGGKTRGVRTLTPAALAQAQRTLSEAILAHSKLSTSSDSAAAATQPPEPSHSTLPQPAFSRPTNSMTMAQANALAAKVARTQSGFTHAPHTTRAASESHQVSMARAQAVLTNMPPPTVSLPSPVTMAQSGNLMNHQILMARAIMGLSNGAPAGNALGPGASARTILPQTPMTATQMQMAVARQGSVNAMQVQMAMQAQMAAMRAASSSYPTLAPITTAPMPTSAATNTLQLQHTSTPSQQPQMSARAPTAPGQEKRQPLASIASSLAPPEPASRKPSALEDLAYIAAVQLRAPVATRQYSTQPDRPPPPTGTSQPVNQVAKYPSDESRSAQDPKRQKRDEELDPLPPNALERKLTSLFWFLEGTKLFGSETSGVEAQIRIPPKLDSQRISPQQQRNLVKQFEQFLHQHNQSQAESRQQSTPSQQDGHEMSDSANCDQVVPEIPSLARAEHSLTLAGQADDTTPLPETGIPSEFSGEKDPAMTKLTTQLSDWLQSFLPYLHQESSDDGSGDDTEPPVLEQSVSEALMSLATSPSRFFSGLSSILDRDQAPAASAPSLSSHLRSETGKSTAVQPGLVPTEMPTQSSNGSSQPHTLYARTPQLKRPATSYPTGRANRSDLLEDYEETPMEKRMRTLTRKP